MSMKKENMETKKLEKMEKIWMDGRLVDWDKANVHILTHALHYGTGVFEGIRAYDTRQGTAVFRLNEHVQRLFNSAKIMRMEVPFTMDEMSAAIKDTIKANKMKSAYIRPMVYRGMAVLGLNPIPCPVKCAVAVWPMGAYLGEEALELGIRVKTSSFIRNNTNSIPAKAKVNGGYVNSALAKMEALEAGYDEAVLLDANGFVAEGSGEHLLGATKCNLYYTYTGCACGITRDSMTIARDLGYQVQETYTTRDSSILPTRYGSAARRQRLPLSARLMGDGLAQEVWTDYKTFAENSSASTRDDPAYNNWLAYV